MRTDTRQAQTRAIVKRGHKARQSSAVAVPGRGAGALGRALALSGVRAAATSQPTDSAGRAFTMGRHEVKKTFIADLSIWTSRQSMVKSKV
eukprot:6210590-Pleurochrysis_carterae.AAC.1